MSKPLTPLNTFSGVSPPWSLTQLDANFSTIAAAVNDVGTYSTIITDTGTVNAMVATMPAGLTFALAAGVALFVQAAFTNTSATVTLNVNGTGAKAVIDDNGNLPSLGAIQVNAIYQFVYDGTSWRCMNPSAGTMLTAVKQVETGRTATVSSNDPELVINIATAGQYEFYCSVYPWTLISPGGFGWGICFTGTLDSSSRQTITGTTTLNTVSGMVPMTTTPSGAPFGIGASVPLTHYSASIQTFGTLIATGAGVLSFVWNGGTNNTFLGKGSYLRVTRLL